MNIDHIGYLCSDIEASINAFELLGYERTSEVIIDNITYGGGGY